MGATVSAEDLRGERVREANAKAAKAPMPVELRTKAERLFDAAENGNAALVTALLEDPEVRSSYIEWRGEHGRTPLLAASKHGHGLVVQILCEVRRARHTCQHT